MLFLIAELGNPSLFPQFLLTTSLWKFQIVLIDSKSGIFGFAFMLFSYF